MRNLLVVLLAATTSLGAMLSVRDMSLSTNPTICDSVQQYSGFFYAGDRKKYFYWFFESRSNPASDPLVMWLNGGPGCSSLMGLFVENGPCHLSEDDSETTLNEFSWNQRANLLYVDQPPGTGFSTGAFDHEEIGVAEDMYSFLQEFFTAFPSYNKDFYVFGESYAGHYVPAITHRIFTGNQGPTAGDGLGATIKINLKGFGIGNGLTDPEVQYPFYPDMAFKSKTAPTVISETTYELMKIAVPVCVHEIKKCNNNSSGPSCEEALMVCNLSMVTPVQMKGINLYDMRLKCENPPLCYDFSKVSTFLNKPETQKVLGVNKRWKDCNMAVNKMFANDWMHRFQDLVAPQLEGGIRVLVYAGDQDYICNWLGNQAWTLSLDWAGKTTFNAAPVTEWRVNGSEAGMTRSALGLTFLQVYKAGHMVPMDQPAASLKMLDDFMADDPLAFYRNQRK